MHFGGLGMSVVGIDNDMRRVFFGDEASTAPSVARLESALRDSYSHHHLDVRNRSEIDELFGKYGSAIRLVVHTAAQPSHDWAAREPFTDFDINAGGTLSVLEATRQHAPEAVFIFTSTNKVYGDTPNRLPFVELGKRWEIEPDHEYANGIREDMTLDDSLHSIFGASKLAADVMVQEYGRYFDMRTCCFRGGTLTGPNHSATELHGFLAYVARCALEERTYTIHGYDGKQVRDVIHSRDLIRAFHEVFQAPRLGEAYNIGGGRSSNCSVLEAIDLANSLTGEEMRVEYSPSARIGDHIWWISDNAKFISHYPKWNIEVDVPATLTEIVEENRDRWKPARVR